MRRNIFGIIFWHPPVPDGRGRAIRFYALAAQGIPLLSLAVTCLPARRAQFGDVGTLGYGDAMHPWSVETRCITSLPVIKMNLPGGIIVP